MKTLSEGTKVKINSLGSCADYGLLLGCEGVIAGPCSKRKGEYWYNVKVNDVVIRVAEADLQVVKQVSTDLTNFKSLRKHSGTDLCYPPKN